MAGTETKRYMELQMEEMMETYGVEEDQKAKDEKHEQRQREKNAKIAELYEDCAEYEEDLISFENELFIINNNSLDEIASVLTEKLPSDERDYEKELKNVLEVGWNYKVETLQSHPKEQLDVIKSHEFSGIANRLKEAFPDYNGDFEAEVKEVVVNRWQTLIAIKKDHIKEEIAEIKTMGLKPNYVKRIYREFHNLK